MSMTSSPLIYEGWPILDYGHARVDEFVQYFGGFIILHK